MDTLDDYGATMTVEEAGRILGLSRSAAYRAARRSEIPTLRFGRRLVVPTAKLFAVLGLPDRRDDDATVDAGAAVRQVEAHTTTGASPSYALVAGSPTSAGRSG